MGDVLFITYQEPALLNLPVTVSEGLLTNIPTPYTLYYYLPALVMGGGGLCHFH